MTNYIYIRLGYFISYIIIFNSHQNLYEEAISVILILWLKETEAQNFNNFPSFK